MTYKSKCMAGGLVGPTLTALCYFKSLQFIRDPAFIWDPAFNRSFTVQ